jgi:Tol biopolymer transport system component
VSASGGATTKLNSTLVNGGDVNGTGLLFTPNSSRVLYAADQDTDEVMELYSAPATGGAPLKLSGPLINGGNVVAGSPQINASGTRVLYVADQNVNEVFDLYGVAAAGGIPVKLNGTLATGGDVSATSARFSPDGARVIYQADQDIDNVFELYSVPSAGGSTVKLNGSLVFAGDVVDGTARVSPDSTHVLYIADEDVNEKSELYNVPITGGTPVKLNGILPSQGDVTRAEFTPDGNRVIYLANEDSASTFELYSVASSGGTPTKLSGPLVDGGNVTDFQISPNGQRVVYRADADTDDVFELYSVSLAGAASVPGDYNHDGIVDAADYIIWRSTLGSTTDMRADGDGTGASAGKIDQADYTFWKSHFGQSGAGAGAAATVPEPASWLLLSMALVLTATRSGTRMLPTSSAMLAPAPAQTRPSPSQNPSCKQFLRRSSRSRFAFAAV